MKNNSKIAVIGAMDCEIELLRGLLKNPEEINAGRFTVFKGIIGNHEVIVARSGVGKVAAASCTQFLTDKFQPDYIINTGVAGGIAEDLSIGDVVVATKLVHHDFDATALGYARGYICNGINPKEPTIFYSDEELNKKFLEVTKKTLPEKSLHKGLIASGDMFIGTSSKKEELKELFGATAAEMESAAIAQTAFLNHIPFLIVRAISDLADGTKTENFGEFEHHSAQISAEIIKNLLNEI